MTEDMPSAQELAAWRAQWPGHALALCTGCKLGFVVPFVSVVYGSGISVTGMTVSCPRCGGPCEFLDPVTERDADGFTRHLVGGPDSHAMLRTEATRMRAELEALDAAELTELLETVKTAQVSGAADLAEVVNRHPVLRRLVRAAEPKEPKDFLLYLGIIYFLVSQMLGHATPVPDVLRDLLPPSQSASATGTPPPDPPATPTPQP